MDRGRRVLSKPCFGFGFKQLAVAIFQPMRIEPQTPVQVEDSRNAG